MVVLITQSTGESNRDYSPLGTGFIFDANGVNVLITAKHMVIEGRTKARRGIGMVVNNTSSGIAVKPLPESQTQWSLHSDSSVDLAATPVQLDPSDEVARMSMDLFVDFDNVREGDDLFFLGFPLGIVSQKEVKPVVRSGIIASKREDSTLLIDANVVPGNSGSPVFLRPVPFRFTEDGISIATGSVTARFLGIISGYLPVQDVAVSRQTGRERVTFEENSGLGIVYSTHHIREILQEEQFQRQLGKLDSEKE